MAVDATNVRVGYRGSVLVAPVGTTVPTDPFDAWNAAFIDMGHISDEGLSEGASQESSEWHAWGYPAAPVRTQVTKEESTFALTFIETKAAVLSIFYSVDVDDMVSVAAASPDPQFVKFTKTSVSSPDVRAMGIDIIDGDQLQRIIVPRAQVTDRGDVNYTTDGLVGYQVTFKALLSSDGTAWQRMYTNVALPA